MLTPEIFSTQFLATCFPDGTNLPACPQGGEFRIHPEFGIACSLHSDTNAVAGAETNIVIVLAPPIPEAPTLDHAVTTNPPPVNPTNNIILRGTEQTLFSADERGLIFRVAGDLQPRVALTNYTSEELVALGRLAVFDDQLNHFRSKLKSDSWATYLRHRLNEIWQIETSVEERAETRRHLFSTMEEINRLHTMMLQNRRLDQISAIEASKPLSTEKFPPPPPRSTSGSPGYSYSASYFYKVVDQRKYQETERDLADMERTGVLTPIQKDELRRDLYSSDNPVEYGVRPVKGDSLGGVKVDMVKGLPPGMIAPDLNLDAQTRQSVLASEARAREREEARAAERRRRQEMLREIELQIRRNAQAQVRQADRNDAYYRAAITRYSDILRRHEIELPIIGTGLPYFPEFTLTNWLTQPVPFDPEPYREERHSVFTDQMRHLRHIVNNSDDWLRSN